LLENYKELPYPPRTKPPILPLNAYYLALLKELHIYVNVKFKLIKLSD
jgi:hypothetical protein